MTNKRYQVFNLEEVLKNNEVSEKLKESIPWVKEPEDRNGLFICHCGIPIWFIGMDGGAPEDQTLRREWRWVEEAMNEAYQKGYENGHEEGSVWGYDKGYSRGYDHGYELGKDKRSDEY